MSSHMIDWLIVRQSAELDYSTGYTQLNAIYLNIFDSGLSSSIEILTSMGPDLTISFW